MKSARAPLPFDARLARKSSGDEAALLIRRMIFDGDLRPGERVPQDDVAATLGISRIPVREALIALEREGWVTIGRKGFAAILKAFQQGDGPAAADGFVRTMRRIGEKVAAVFRDRGLFEPTGSPV